MGTARGALVAGLTIGVLAFVGCGGSDDSAGGAGPISKKEFIAKADRVCKKGTERMQAALIQMLKGNPNIAKVSKAAQERFVKTGIVPSVSREVEELRALGIPDGDEEKVDAMITALEEGIETAERDPQAVTKSTEAVFGIAGRLGGEYGLEACGAR